MGGVTCKVPADWLHAPSVCWYDWQTLIAGLAAVLIGGITVFYLHKQIAQTDRLANEERAARLVVARAKLIVPSSELASHAKACLDALATAVGDTLGKPRSRDRPTNLQPCADIAAAKIMTMAGGVPLGEYVTGMAFGTAGRPATPGGSDDWSRLIDLLLNVALREAYGKVDRSRKGSPS